eukprot:CAMPEP_0194394342 /NCGR_PEP_ID=MMETSP0174-20130528/123803_1 /TAXON_ID=216777 /ORGANISM="Proboscia alata, Strain PI-D3" /LENGTH=130 /DNA_ID=CAMNT_0039190133 /DNA_START=764 /DNA_END=1156 /DNA_ORIENTATION=-
MGGNENKNMSVTEGDITLSKKDLKRVDKLSAQIPYQEGRNNKEEVEKIKNQVDAILTKTREAAHPSYCPAADLPPTTAASIKVVNETSTEKKVINETSAENKAKRVDRVTVLGTLRGMKNHFLSGCTIYD